MWTSVNCGWNGWNGLKWMFCWIWYPNLAILMVVNEEKDFFEGEFGSTFLFGGFYFFVGIFHANGMIIRYPCRWVKAAVLLATCSLDFSWFWRFGQLQKMGMEPHWHRHQIGVSIVIIYRTDLHSSMRSQKSIRRSHKIYFGCASQLASGFYMGFNPYITGIIVPYVYIRGVP